MILFKEFVTTISPELFEKDLGLFMYENNIKREDIIDIKYSTLLNPDVTKKNIKRCVLLIYEKNEDDV